MTQHLEHIFQRASRLSEARQQQIAREVNAILERVEREEGTSGIEHEPALNKRPTAHDLGKHLAGIFEGPGDLSYNPKYMEDFGKSSSSE